jgi:hypothetical protein
MALPKIKHPTYKVVIPTSQKTVSFRPYTVLEEKLLMMARSSEVTEDIISSIKQVLQNCIIEPIDVENLATVDVEYLFLKLRSKSVNETVDLEYTDPETKEIIKFNINLEEVEVKKNPDHTNKIMLQDDIGIVFKYPTLDDVRTVETNDDQEAAAFEVLLNCVEKIFDGDNVYSEFNKEELEEFINSLPIESMNKMREFFDTLPVLEHTVTLKNKKGETRTVILKGITSFFTY